MIIGDADTRRFHGKVDRSGDCWLWTGGVGSSGYGGFWLKSVGNNVGAHRVALFIATGEDPGEHTHHKCENKLCVNPAHLSPLSAREHMLAGSSRPALQARQTHCKQGHEFNETNTYVSKRGERMCRPCRAEAQRRYVERKHAC